jgi:hypothetical protein
MVPVWKDPPWVRTPKISSPSPPAAGGEGRGEEAIPIVSRRPERDCASEASRSRVATGGARKKEREIHFASTRDVLSVLDFWHGGRCSR